jgi:hypothetical protein
MSISGSGFSLLLAQTLRISTQRSTPVTDSVGFCLLLHKAFRIFWGFLGFSVWSLDDTFCSVTSWTLGLLVMVDTSIFLIMQYKFIGYPLPLKGTREVEE